MWHGRMNQYQQMQQITVLSMLEFSPSRLNAVVAFMRVITTLHRPRVRHLTWTMQNNPSKLNFQWLADNGYDLRVFVTERVFNHFEWQSVLEGNGWNRGNNFEWRCLKCAHCPICFPHFIPELLQRSSRKCLRSVSEYEHTACTCT